MPRTREIAKVVAVANFGTWIDWYDYFLSAFVATTVWPSIFFPSTLPPNVAMAYSIIAFATIYAARPIGAYIFGHYGDTVGRKTALVWTMLTMGLGVLAIGIEPGYETLGLMAPILLGVFRFVQGLGLGGEYGAVITWVGEYASKSKWRTFWVGITQATVYIGTLTASVAMTVGLLLLPRAAFISWGWRIPYLLGASVAFVAVLIRTKFGESPLFMPILTEHRQEKYPASLVLKRHWKKTFALAFIPMITVGTTGLIQIPFGLPYMESLGIPLSFATLSVTVGAASTTMAVILGSVLGCKIRKRLVLCLACVCGMAIMVPYFWLIQTLNPVLIIVAQMLYGLQSMGAGVQNPILVEQYPTKIRTSGTGLATQLTGIYGGIATGVALPWLLLTAGSVRNAWPIVAAGGIIMLAGVFVVAIFVKEPKPAPLEELDR
jgi:MFS family permease